MSSLSPTAPQRLEFTGSGSEYFGIWIVNIALTIVTFGIYSAWAKVRRLRYFYGHTRLAGHGFAYLAQPIKILKGRIVAIGLLVIYSACWNFFPEAALVILCAGVLMLPFIIVTASAFNMRNSAYRNVRFHFRTDYREAYRICILPLAFALAIAAILYTLFDPAMIPQPEEGPRLGRQDILPSFFLIGILPVIPWLDYVRSRFLASHTQFGNIVGEFHATAASFYGLYAKAVGFMLLAGVLVFGMIILVAIVAGGASGNADVGEPSAMVGAIATFVALIGMYGAMFFISAWFRARRTNLIRNNVQFGVNRLYGDLSARSVAWLFFSNAVAVVFTLGLMIPWAWVRMARYVAQHTAIDAVDLDTAVAIAQAERSAIGEEIGDAFDLDIGL